MEFIHVVIVLVLILIFVGPAISKRRQSGLSLFAPAYPAVLESPLAEADPPFDRGLVATVDKAMPVFSEKVLESLKNLEFLKKEKELHEHVSYLTETKQKIDSYYGGCIERYRAARQHLVRQRDALRITLMQAKKVTEGLSSSDAKRSDIKLPAPINVPPAPIYETIQQLEAKTTALVRGVGQTGAQLAGKAQGASGAGIAVIGTLVVGTAMSIVMFQKSVRKLTASHGEMNAYALRAGDHVEELKASYRELMATSQEIYKRDVLLRSFITDISAPGLLNRYREGNAAPAENRLVTTLMAHSMMADGYVVMGD